MGILAGSSQGSELVKATNVFSVFVSAGSGGASVLKVYDYQDTTHANPMTINCPQSGSAQFSFRGLPFSSGLKVVPDANTACYIVEYGDK